MLWLVLYSTVADQAMQGIGISNYTAFILPGLMVLVSFGACSSSGIMNYLMKTDGSFYRILIAPVKRSSIVLGQLLEAVACTFIEVTIICHTSLLFSVHIATGLIGILLIAMIMFLTSFFISGLTYAISLVLPNEVIYETIINAIVLPIFFLSTALFPIDGLTGGLKIAVNLNPFTHVINVLRALILQESIVFSDVVFVLSLLVILCGISFLWAYHRLRKESVM
jgi:ABC-2 type transport system permease protein